MINKLSQFGVPGAIIIGAALVAAVLYVTDQTSTQAQSGVVTLERVTDARIYGSKRAPVRIVEFSDIECPFCARVHPTFKRLVDESNGQISWEYRHLPLPNHRNAELGARAAECIADLGSDEAYWEFLDIAFANQGSHSMSFYRQTAESLGVSGTQFEVCANSNQYDEMIAADIAAARAFGGSGTPFTVLVFADGSTRPVSGALPYKQWANLLQDAR